MSGMQLGAKPPAPIKKQESVLAPVAKPSMPELALKMTGALQRPPTPGSPGSPSVLRVGDDHSPAGSPVPGERKGDQTARELRQLQRILDNKDKTQVEQLFAGHGDEGDEHDDAKNKEGETASAAAAASSTVKTPERRRRTTIKEKGRFMKGMEAKEVTSKPILSEEEALKFQWEDYAKENFQRLTRKQGFKKVLMPWDTQVNFQRFELSDSLHPFTEKQRKNSQRLQAKEELKRAQEVRSKSIMGMLNEYEQLLMETGGSMPSDEQMAMVKEADRKEREEILKRRKLKDEEKKNEQEDTKINKKLKKEEEAELLRRAVKNFETILAYEMMDVAVAAEKLSADEVAKQKRMRMGRAIKAIQFIQMNGMKHPKLRDEIYCQLVKQLHRCPVQKVEQRTWQLLAIITGLYAPSPKFLPYMVSFLYRMQRDSMEMRAKCAAFCLRRLERCHHNGDRKHPMGPAELDATFRFSDFTVPIELPDGTIRSLVCDSSTTVPEVYRLVCRKVGLKDPRGWAVFEVFDKLERSLVATDMVADEYSKLQQYELAEKQNELSDQKEVDYSRGFKFMFRKKLHLDPRELSDDNVENHLLYHQTVQDFLDDRLPCDEKDAKILGSLLLQFDGDYTPPVKTPEQLEEEAKIEAQKQEGIFDEELLKAVDTEIDLYSVVPKQVVLTSEKDELEWDKELIELHKALKGMPHDKCQRLFLQHAKKLPLFGTTVYSVTHRSNLDMPAQVGLAVAIDGIMFVDPETQQVIRGISLPVIERIEFDRQQLRLFFDTTSEEGSDLEKKMVILTKQAIELKSLIHEYMEWLKLESEWCQATKDHEVDDPKHLSFKSGQMVKILARRSDGYWLGTLEGKTGVFPEHKVKVILTRMELKTPREAVTRDMHSAAREAEEEDAKVSFLQGHKSETMKAEERARNMGAATMMTTKDRFASTKIKRIDTSKFTMRTFASRSFRTMSTFRTGTFRGKQKEYNLEDRISWQKEPLQDSLTLTKSEEYNKKAESLFVMIQKWMGDQSIKVKDGSREEVAQNLIQLGIDKRMLRDELMCQIVKQSTENPDHESTVKGWHLLNLCVGCFLPSQAFARHLIGHVQDHQELTEGPLADIGALANACYERIGRTIKRGSRKKCPSREEIAAVCSNRPMLCRIEMMDGSVKTVMMDSACIVEEILGEVFQKMDITYDQKSLETYSIFLTCDELSVSTPLAISESVGDRLRWAESYGKENSSGGGGKKGKGGGAGEELDMEWRFVFRRRLFLFANKIDCLEMDAGHLYLTFWQTVREVAAGRHPVDMEEMPELAAIHLQVEFGEHQHLFSESTMYKYIPKILADQQSFADWQFKLLSPAAKLRQLDRRQLQLRYIEICRKWKYWGSSVFPVRRQQKPQDVNLVVNFRGAGVFLPGVKEPVHWWGYENFLNWSATPRTWIMRSGDATKNSEHKFYTRQANDIRAIFQAYLDVLINHVQARKKEKMVQQTRNRVKAATTKKKGSHLLSARGERPPTSLPTLAPPPPSMVAASSSANTMTPLKPPPPGLPNITPPPPKP